MFSIFNTFVFILYYSCCLCYPESFNFIQNWDFELTTMDGIYTIDYAEKWKTKSINVNTYPKFQSAGQYLDLQDFFNQNGQAEQEMKLPLNRKCQLNYFYWGYNASKFYSYVMQIYWNGQLLLTKTAQTIEPKFSQPLSLVVTKQVNTLRFREIGINKPYPQDDCSGMFVDNVTLICPTQSVQANQQQYLKLFSTLLIASSYKFSPQILLSFGQVFDDLQFYIFHNKHYPKTVQYFLSKAQLIQLGRFKQFYEQLLWFIQQTPNITLFPSNKMQQYIEISSIKQKQLFFTKSFYADCLGNILFSITLFIAFKIVQIMLFYLQQHFEFAKKIYRYVDKNSQFWIYFSSIVQGNLTTIAWSFGIQAILLSCANGLQKFNVLISISIFFIVLFYSTVFYPSLFSLKNKERSKMVLVCCNYNSKSYFYQPFLLLIKLICRSYIHSFCLKNYTLQIFCLAFCDLLCISLCIKMKNSFQNIYIFLCYLIYNFAFATFDIFFYLESTQVITNTEDYRELFGLVTVLIIIASNSLVILIFLFCSLRSILKLMVKKIKKYTNILNKIQPCSKEKNKTKKKILLKLKDSQQQMKGQLKIERKEASKKQRSKVLVKVDRKVEESKTVAKINKKSNLDKIKKQRA